MDTIASIYFTLDTTPPSIISVIQIPPQSNVLPEDKVKVNATITDDLSGIKKVILNYIADNGTWNIVDMMNIQGDVWNATIPAFPYGTNVTYNIIAEDIFNNMITSQEIGLKCQYNVIPEFPSLIILPLFMTATLIAAAFYRKHRQSH